MTVIPELDHPEGSGPKTYWMLVAALQRLLDDEPIDPVIVAMREEAGADGRTRPVPITQLNVAIESGNENRRKFISGTKHYRKLAEYIVSLRSTHGVSENTTRKLERQAEDIALLDQKVRALRSQVLVAVEARHAAERALLDAEGTIVRLKKQLAG